MTRPDGEGGESDLPTGSLWDEWDSPLRVPTILELHLDGFHGPLGLLLDLAARERIDLNQFSVSDMVDQFVVAMACYESRVPLERRADWLTWWRACLYSGRASSCRNRPRRKKPRWTGWNANAVA